MTPSRGNGFDRGYISPHFVLGDERANMEIILEDAYVLVCEKALHEEILPIIEKVIADKSDRSLLIIAENIEDRALSFLLQNRLAGKKFIAVKHLDLVTTQSYPRRFGCGW